MYSILREIIPSGRRITTVEDPVEEQIEGIHQQQINPAHGLGYEQALRSHLRQDPDVIMVSQCRDIGVLEAILHISITGHLALTMLHVNETTGVLRRLLDMGGEPYNNLIKDNPTVVNPVAVDFAKHAEAMGAMSETVTSVDELEEAFGRAKAADRTYVIALVTDAYSWTEGGSFWEVGVPEVSELEGVRNAKADMVEGKKEQRI